MKNYLFALFFLLSACITPGKVSTYLSKEKNKPEADVIVQQYLTTNELLAAQFCARTYPVKESTDTKTETTKGNTEELKTELAKAEAEADSLLQVLNALPVKDDCKPEAAARDKVIRTLQNRIAGLSMQATNLKADVERVTTTRTQENQAHVVALQKELEIQKQAYSKSEAQRQVTQQDLKETKQQLTRAYLFGGILIVAMAGLLFLLFRR